MPEAVIVGGVRTPFVKAGADLIGTPAPELGRLVVQELLYRCGVLPENIDELIAGNVASPVDAANVARVIALRANIPKDRIAHTVNRNCASGMESVTQAVARITSGAVKSVVAVGVDSMSNVPLLFRKRFGEKLLKLSKAKTAGQKLSGIAKFRPSDFAPLIGLKLGLTDPVSDLMMGDTAEKLAREYGISRDDQDQFAVRSHAKAVKAWKEGRLSDETMTLYPQPKSEALEQDIGPRDGQSMEALGRMKPYFDRKWGTVTVGNSCGVTDGAAALLLMEADYADSLGLQPIGRIRSAEFAGCDPSRMGLGPVYSSAKALKSAGMTMEDVDLVELNEAFAAQVLACLKGFESPPEDCVDSDAASRLRPIDEDKLNVNGGAIAIGHPVGATGARLILTLLGELGRRDQNVGLATLCIGGGQGGAAIVERTAA
ncbi:MAG: thiolase family protein [Planctomycetaceae bacterium]|nr:thiolase family protein [Planctomycetaceae bacterium]